MASIEQNKKKEHLENFLKELGIKRPLRVSELNKDDIRTLSKDLELPTWNKQSFACLSSRFVYGETISEEKLKMVDKAEQLLLDMGFYPFTARRLRPLRWEMNCVYTYLIGCVIALIGISIISFSGTTMHLNPIGDILSVGAAMVWSFYAVLSKKMGAFGYSVIQTTRRTFFYGILFMIPALYFFDFKWDLYRFSTPAYIFNIFYLGLGAPAICFVTWNLAVRILGAIKTSVYIYLAPVVTAVASVIVLHEKITFLSGLGIVLVLGGLLLSEQKKKLFFIRGRKHTENVVE